MDLVFVTLYVWMNIWTGENVNKNSNLMEFSQALVWSRKFTWIGKEWIDGKGDLEKCTWISFVEKKREMQSQYTMIKPYMKSST